MVTNAKTVHIYPNGQKIIKKQKRPTEISHSGYINIFLLFIFIVMATTYGINFPFGKSLVGDYLRMTINEEEEVRTKDRKSTRLNSSHVSESRMPSSA